AVAEAFDAAPGEAAADLRLGDELAFFVDLADLAAGIDPDVVPVGELAGVIRVSLSRVVEDGLALAGELDDALIRGDDGVAVGQTLQAGGGDAGVLPALVAAGVDFVDEAVARIADQQAAAGEPLGVDRVVNLDLEADFAGRAGFVDAAATVGTLVLDDER